MPDRYRLTDVETVRREGSWLFTIRNHDDEREEAILVPCGDPDADSSVEAWVNRCTHEDQRLHRQGVGAVFRDGEIVCPRHGSTFDTCSGYCDNGEAAESTLLPIEIDVDDGQVYLTDDAVDFLYEGGIQDESDDDGPSSTSHIQF